MAAKDTQGFCIHLLQFIPAHGTKVGHTRLFLSKSGALLNWPLPQAAIFNSTDNKDR
jgi:hypothetical protein